MALRARRIVAVFGALMLLCGMASAQEIDYDYRAYKLYKDDEPLLTMLEDTLKVEHPQAGYVANVTPMSEYSLRRLNYRNMGEFAAESYALGGCYVDYTTARMLSQLRLSSEVDRGGLGRAIYSTKLFNPNDRLYRGQSIGAELNCRGYSASLSYYAGYKPEYKGVKLKDGWSFRHAVRLAGGDDLYVDGVSANILDLSFGATWSDKRNRLNLFAFLPLSERGLRRASVDESYSLLGNKLYNPLWGIDNGELRNSRMATAMRPEIVAAWDYRVTISTTMHLVSDLYYSKEGVTSLSWFDAPTPLPDNYHYLPSYYDYPSDKRYVTDAWLSNDLRYTQVDWVGMRHTNALQRDGHARYVVESRREDSLNGDILLSFDTKLQGVGVNYGLRLGAVNYHRYKVLDDLLGATHILDLDYFLVDDATHYNGTINNLQSDELVITEGDTFGYNYAIRRFKSEIFGSADWEYGDMRFAVSANIGSERILRNGYFEKELYRGEGSYGRSQCVVLNPYAFVFAWSYHVDNHIFGASLQIAAESPGVDNLFFNPEYNNRIVADVVEVKRRMARLSYALSANESLRLSALLFANHYTGGVEVLRYYDDLSGIFSNGVVSGISWLGYGADVAAEISWNRLFSSNFRAVVSSYRYSDNANMMLYANDDNHLIANSLVHIKGCHRGSAELAAYGDISYRHRGWRATASLSWCDGGYVAPSFVPRMDRVLSFTTSDEERSALLEQRDLDSATLIELSISKRIQLKNGMSLSTVLKVSNLLGGSWVANGYESNRIRCVTNGYYSRVFKSAEMVSYSYPRMFNLSLNLWF